MTLNSILSAVFDPIVKLVEKIGLAKTIGYVVIFACIGYTVYGVSTIDKSVIKAIDQDYKERAEAHDNAVEKRYANSPKVDEILREVLYKYNADRTCIVEMHNGTNNIAGLPFIYGEMTYEECRDGIASVDKDYTRFNLSRISMPTFMINSNRFCGSMTDLAKIDEKFADRLLSNGSTYLAGYTLYGNDGPLGFFGIIWCGDAPSVQKDKLMGELAVYTQKLQALLNK